MKLNLATVGFILFGLAIASPEPHAEAEAEIEGQYIFYSNSST
jgi:hypothetical protein